jgi:hypothetical protein
MRHIATSFVAPRSPLHFSTLSHKRCDFRKNVIEHKISVLILSTTFRYNISHSRKNLATYRQKCLNVFMLSTRYSCRILMKREFSRQIFEEHSNIKFHQNPFSGSRVVACGQTEGHEANSRFSKFCERA